MIQTLRFVLIIAYFPSFTYVPYPTLVSRRSVGVWSTDTMDTGT